MNKRLQNASFLAATIGAVLALGAATSAAVVPRSDQGAETRNIGEISGGETPIQLADTEASRIETTAQVVKTLEDGARDCGGFRLEYRLDCLRQVFRDARSKIERRQHTQRYRPAVRELARVERQLNAIVRRHVDRKAPTIEKPKKRVRKFDRVRAVKKAATGIAHMAAEKAISEGATRLLRSTSNSAHRAHFVKIAQAMDSTKRILRS